jgi:hypothetical protein
MKVWEKRLLVYDVNNTRESNYQMANVVSRSWIHSTLKMEAVCSSETALLTRLTRRHIPEDGIIKGFPGVNVHFTHKHIHIHIYVQYIWSIYVIKICTQLPVTSVTRSNYVLHVFAILYYTYPISFAYLDSWHVAKRSTFLLCKIWCFHGGNNEGWCLVCRVCLSRLIIDTFGEATTVCQAYLHCNRHTTMEITLQEPPFLVRREVHPRCKPWGLKSLFTLKMEAICSLKCRFFSRTTWRRHIPGNSLLQHFCCLIWIMYCLRYILLMG